MANLQQQRSFQRKLIYIAAIVVLFGATWYYRTRLQARAVDLAMVEEAKGEVELGGSAVRLLLTGSRGLAVCVLWLQATDAQKKNEWNKLELISSYIAKLQPHFVSPWLFQSWNIAYNVSHEAHRPLDKYYYIARGTQMLAEGERRNRNNPEIRWHIAFYYQQKIGQHDEKDTLMSLFQLSCIDPLERDPARFYSYQWTDLAANRARADGVPSAVVDKLRPLGGPSATSFSRQDLFQSELKERLADKDYKRYQEKIVRSARVLKPYKFVAFCRNHPELVRRLRDRAFVHLTNHTHKDPNEVVEFLEENRDVLSLYVTGAGAVEGSMEEDEADEIPKKKTRKADDEPAERFPLLPPRRDVLPYPQQIFDKSELTADDVLGDDVDSFAVARSWFGYSLEPMPRPSSQRPGYAQPVENRVTQRMPKRMRSILYRTQPAIAQSFICDRLIQEGWFERWNLIDAFDPNRDALFRGQGESQPRESEERYLVGPDQVLKKAWDKDFRMWQRVNDENYLMVDRPKELDALRMRGQRFLEEYPSRFDTPFSVALTRREEMPADLVSGYDAAVFVHFRDSSTNLSNINTFYFRALVEKEDQALRARRHFFEGDDRTRESNVRIRNYVAGLRIWKEILEANPALRSDASLEQDLYEYELKYLYYYQQQVTGGQLIAHALLAQELLGMAAAAPADANQRLLGAGQLDQYEKNNRDWPPPFILGPLDGTDQLGDVYVRETAKEAVATRFPDNARRAGRPPKPKQIATGPGSLPTGPTGPGIATAPSVP